MVALLALAACAGCTPDKGEQEQQSTVELVVPTDPVGLSVASPGAGKPVSIGSIPLCLSDKGHVEIDEVEPVGPTGGLQVKAFAVRMPTGDFLGEVESSLTDAGFGTGTVVDAVCSPHDTPDELGVELRAPSGGTARAQALRITWRSGGDERTSTVPFTVVLCKDRQTNAGDCVV